MKINALEIDGYGVWSGLRVERLSDELNVVYGPNEAGKTTLLQFVRSMLYGFSPERQRYLPPVHGGRPGGNIDIDTPHGAFQLERHADDDGPQVIVTAADGTRQGEHVLKMLLSDIDEAIFNNVFAVGLREIQELGTLGDTQAADLLYNLASGLDRVSLVEVMHALQESRDRILNSSGGPCQLSQLLHEREKLRLEVEELSTLLRRYGRLAADRGQLDRDVTRLEEEKNQAEHQALAVELSIGLREPWQRRQALDDELAALGPQVDVPDGILPRLDAILARLQKYERRRQRVAAQRKDLRAEAGGLAINEALARHAARIAALQEQETWMQTLSTQVGDLQKEIAALESALAAEQKRLGLGGLSQVSLDENGTVPVHGAELSRRAIERLRVPGRALQQGRHRWKKAREEAATAGQAAQTLTAQLQTALAAHEAPDVATATDRAGNLVAQLRRRTQVDERLDQLTRNQTELTEESQHLLGRQLLPGWILAVLGGAFVLGVVLILAGLLLQTSLTGAAGWLLALLGVAGAVLAAGGKFLLDRSHDQQYETGQRQLTMLAAQIKQAKEERDVLDTQLPHGGGPLAVRLTAAEKELAALEELLPVDTRRAAAAQSSTAAATQADAARRAYREAHRAWVQSLRAAGLPPKVLPRQITQLLSGCEQIQELARRLSARREELQQRRRELDLLHGRIAQLVADTGVAVAAPGSTAPGSAGSSSTGPDPAGQLRQLGEALNRQHGELARREAIRVELRQWRRRQGRWAEAVARCKQQRRVLFRQAGVEDEAALRQRAGEAARAAELRRERSAVDHDIVAAIGGHCSQENVRQFLTAHAPAELTALRDELFERVAATEKLLHQRLEQRGQLAAEMKILADDRQLALKQLQLATMEKRLQDLIRRWQVLAVTYRLLETIRTTYEQQRQPETLQEASGYLNRLTQGRYLRVWTPLGQQVLRVDDGEGHALPVEVLSRGTREQLFLSLRLALSACYARRGAMLPLVLDDVLVNFDAPRAKAAATVLRDFAATGHQLLVFTCHEHIFKLFKSLRVPTTRLPDNADAEHATIAFEGLVKEKDKDKDKEKPLRGRSASKPAAKPQPPEEEEEVEEAEEEAELADEVSWEEEDEGDEVPWDEQAEDTESDAAA